MIQPNRWKIALLSSLCVVAFCWCTPTVQAAPLTLEQMENQLFAHPYSGEPQAARLSRLETAVFGQPSANLPASQRVQHLSQFFRPEPEPASSQIVSGSPGPRINQPVTGKTPPPAYANSAAQLPVQAGETDYPIVSALEDRVFQQRFTTETLDQRLARLEGRVLGAPQHGDLQQRTDQLRMMVLGDTGQGSPQAMSAGPNRSPGLPNSGFTSNAQSASASADVQKALSNLEQKALKQTYPMEPLEARLSRLEMKVFNATAPEMSPEDRVYRIAGVMTAQSSSRRERVTRGGTIYGSPYGGGRVSSGSGMGSMSSMLLMILMSLL